MNDELPPLWALDKAEKAAHHHDWQDVTLSGWREGDPAYASIIAHARTIAQHEQPPVDEDALLLARFLRSAGHIDPAWRLERNSPWPVEAAALAQFKRELEARK